MSFNGKESYFISNLLVITPTVKLDYDVVRNNLEKQGLIFKRVKINNRSENSENIQFKEQVNNMDIFVSVFRTNKSVIRIRSPSDLVNKEKANNLVKYLFDKYGNM